MAKNKVSIDFVIGAYDRFSAAFARFNAKLESATGAVSRMQAQVSRFGQRSGLSQVAGAAAGVAGAFAGMGDGAMESLGRVTGALGKMSLLLGGASGGMVALASATAEQAQAAERSAEALGVNATDLQKLQYAASTVNVEAEDMTDILSDLTEKMVEAGDSDDLAAMFKALGVSLKNADGSMKNSAQVIMEISDAFSRMQDGPVKTKLAIELMGDAGRRLIPVLNKGAAGLRDLGREAEQAGLVFDGAARSDAKRFQEALRGVGDQTAGLRNAIGRQLMPVLTPVMEKFEGWLALNKNLVATKTGEWVRKVADNLPAFLDGAERWITTGGKVLAWCTDFIDRTIGMENALKLVALYMGTPFIRSLFSAGKAVAAFSLAIMTTPVGWFMAAVAAIAGAGYLIIKNWDKITAWWNETLTVWQADIDHATSQIMKAWEAVKNFFSGLWNDITGIFSDAWNSISGIVTNITDAVKTVTDALPSWDGIKEGAGNAWNGFTEGVRGLFGGGDAPETVSTGSGFTPLARSGVTSSETVHREEKVEKHDFVFHLPEGVTLSGDRQSSDAVTVKRDNMGYGWAFAGV